MAIPESQLDTWAHQGSISQSSTTYNTIKNVLEAADTPYVGKNYSIFLQGSYGNDTNIYAESDVDIVIKLDDCFQKDLYELSQTEKDAFKHEFDDAKYTHVDFKRDVIKVLMNKYGSEVKYGDKAIAIATNGNRRKADVIAAIQFRRYYKFKSNADQSYDEGICFYTSAGEEIVNYPIQHTTNLTSKHQNSNKWFKPMVRIIKNLRSKLIDEKLITSGIAPSYYIEGLLFNVPNEKFGGSYEESLVNCFNWILEADRSKFVCANKQYYLLRDDPHVTWSSTNCDKFLNAVVELWKQW